MKISDFQLIRKKKNFKGKVIDGLHELYTLTANQLETLIVISGGLPGLSIDDLEALVTDDLESLSI